jgi:hypothetical protein
MDKSIKWQIMSIRKRTAITSEVGIEYEIVHMRPSGPSRRIGR